MKKSIYSLLFTSSLCLLLASCCEKTDHVRILATSDTHGMFAPCDYALVSANPGSLAQVGSAVKELRDENTLLIEVGDVIQGNSSELFLEDEMHPMILAMNVIGYDYWVTGNHEYNFGTDYLRKIIAMSDAKLLTGNVYDPSGKALAPGYQIVKKNGVKIGIIGMVTPNIVNWDKVNLEGWTVTNPTEETRALVTRLRSKVDILIAAEHMGMDNEYGVPGSGVRDLANACPELDLIIAAHAHIGYADSLVNGVPIVANRGTCNTMTMVDFERTDSGWQAIPRLINIAEYEADSAVMEAIAPYHGRALAQATEVIGHVKGGDLIPESRFAGVMDAHLEDSPWADLIARAMQYYSQADVVASFIVPTQATIKEGDITRADCSIIYKYAGNSMYVLRVTGHQLRKYMEWSAAYFSTYEAGQPLTFNTKVATYNFDMFTGVDYEINVSQPAGHRIENLVWSESKAPVLDTDTFTLAVSNYRANTHLRNDGEILNFAEDGMPEVLGIDVAGQIGGIRELIVAYITDVLHGEIVPECDHNWRLTGLPSNFTAQRKASRR